MRRLFGWMAGLAGVAALARLLSARQARRAAATPRLLDPARDPADALREKLAHSRTEIDETAMRAEEPIPAADPPGGTLDERRALIHAKAQEAIDSMQEDPS